MQLLMGFDFGLRFIGVAIGQSITASATGLTTLQCRRPKNAGTSSGGEPRWHEIAQLLEQHQPTALVVGLPLNMDGSESEMASLARGFAADLTKRYKLPVLLHDERLTSRAAMEILDEARSLGRASTDHELAACLILESWFSENQMKT